MNSNMARTAYAAVLALGLISPAQALDSPWLSRMLLQTTPSHTLNPLTLPAIVPAPSSAMNYARSADVNLSVHEHGRWSLEGPQAVWRLKLRSEGAQNLSTTLSELSLPATAQLRIFDAGGALWHGPLHADQLQRHARFWTPLVPADNLLLELSVPTAQRAQTRMRISQIHHGDVAWQNGAKSGSCNVDVACSAADAWTDAVRATARITIGGRRLCSAVLLNNTAQDGSPLLLTAQHCGIGESTDMGADSVVVYWNFETSRCDGDPDGNLRQFQSGSTLLAEGASADFSLVRLSQVPPAQYDVYYAGWDARSLAPANGVSVHHPNGDEKRISIYRQQAQARSANVDGNRVQSWEVFWDQGITEAGSSGGGLWNSAHRVVGQLSGGNSSCSNPDASDVFGRLESAWDASSASTGQLRAWLDAAQTGQLTLDGLDSRNTSLKAADDQFPAVPAESQTLRLDVLNNDAGARPLRLLDAQTDTGQVRIEGQQLIYQFAAGQADAQIEYQLMDRWGESSSAQVELHKPELRAQSLASPRGGALGGGLLILFLPLLQCRFRSKR